MAGGGGEGVGVGEESCCVFLIKLLCEVCALEVEILRTHALATSKMVCNQYVSDGTPLATFMVAWPRV